VIDAATDREIIVVAKDLVVVGGLQRSAAVSALVKVRSTVPHGVVAQVFPLPGGQLIGWLLALRIWKFACGWVGNPSFSRHNVLNSGLA
jgi:hypothetical protein